MKIRKLIVFILALAILLQLSSATIFANEENNERDVYLSWDDCKNSKNNLSDIFGVAYGNGDISWDENSGRVTFQNTSTNAISGMEVIAAPDDLHGYVVEADIYLTVNGNGANTLLQMGVFHQNKLMSGYAFQYYVQTATSDRGGAASKYNVIRASSASSNAACCGFQYEDSQYTIGTKLSVKIVVENNEFSVYYNGNKINTLLSSAFVDTKSEAIPQKGNPFFAVRQKCTIQVDNLNIYKTSTTNVSVVGTQESIVNNGFYNVRFVAQTLSLNYNEVGFEITASYIDESDNIVTKNYNIACTTVYRSIIQNNGITEVINAQDGSFFFALTIKNIPISVGDITFTIKPYAKTNSIKVFGETKTANYSNGQFVVE